MKRHFALVLSGLIVTSMTWADDRNHKVEAMALYSQGQAVVQDHHAMDLDQGKQTVEWPVVGTLQPDSFWLSAPDIELLGFDLNTVRGGQGSSPLEARLGHRVDLYDLDGEKHEGELEAVDGQTAYVRVDDRIEQVGVNGITRLGWPDEDGSKANHLTLHLDAAESGKQELAATYLMQSPGWQASYTGHLDAEEGQLTLSAQAVIDNSHHEDIEAEHAWLVTGSSDGGGGAQPMMRARSAGADGSDEASRPEAVGDRYRYPLRGGLDVPAGQVQSVALLKPFKVDARRTRRFENQAMNDQGNTRQHARVTLRFDNTSQAPLPAGSVRVYDAEHKAQLLGASRIGDTPAGAPVKLALGESFDVTATHQVTHKSTADDGSRESEVTVKLSNAADRDKRVTVAEQLPGDAELTEDGPEPGGGSAHKPEWRTTVPADGHKILTYRFRQPSRQGAQ